MGCCLSTNKDSASQEHNVGSESLQHKKPSFSESRAPPPSVEEETVKEVLSSITPKPKPQQVPISETLKPKSHIQEPDKKTTTQHHNHNPVFDKIKQKIETTTVPHNITNNNNNTTDDHLSVSEVSEICSVSMSESVSTTTITTETRDYEEEVVKQRVSRSPAKLLPPPRNRVVGRSPTRRSDQSPGTRNGSVRTVQNREPGQGMVRRGSRPDPNRRDQGESSGRRSRSPAINRSVMGRSTSVRRSNRSPGRVGSDNKVEECSNVEAKWPPSNGATSSNATTNESLENPLVSLECFIFL